MIVGCSTLMFCSLLPSRPDTCWCPRLRSGHGVMATVTIRHRARGGVGAVSFEPESGLRSPGRGATNVVAHPVPHRSRRGRTSGQPGRPDSPRIFKVERNRLNLLCVDLDDNAAPAAPRLTGGDLRP